MAELPKKQITQLREGMRVRHYKGGNVYVVLARAMDVDYPDSSDLVVYRSTVTDQAWVRKYKEFMGMVFDGTNVVPRFEEVTDG